METQAQVRMKGIPMLLALLLFLTQSPGWEDVFTCYDKPAAENPCDVRIHPHLADIGIPGQLGCDTAFPQFGAIGTTLRLWCHRNRCTTVGAVFPPGTPVLALCSLGVADPILYDPLAGWGYLDLGQVIGSLAMSPADADGFAYVDIEIPDDPGLVGLATYWQALANVGGVLRESTGGRLEVW